MTRSSSRGLWTSLPGAWLRDGFSCRGELNALQAGAGFKLVDPDGLVAEAECDLGLLMRGDPVELLDTDPRERAWWLAARTGLDATAIWEWGVIERVASGLHCEEIDLQPLGRQMLAAIEAVAGVDMS